MTDHANAELIAEARQLGRHSSVSAPEHANMLGRLADALEAAEKRADQVEATAEHLHDEDTREIVALTQERDAALAVIEKVRAYAESIPRTRDRDVNPGLSNRSWLTAQDVLGILASAPADALREHDAALIEGLADEYADSGREQTHGVTSVLSFLYTRARQRREEQS